MSHLLKLNPTTRPDTLKTAARRKRTIKVLIAHIRALRGQKAIDDTLHQKERKELVQATREVNQLNKKLNAKVESLKANKELIHLREIVKTQGIKILNQSKRINIYEMEKLNV